MLNKDPSAISFHRVSFSYPDRQVLRGVHFSINKGAFIGMIGPNGGGKTTLLQLILGFLKPNEGEVLLSEKKQSLGSSLIGYVPQALRFDRFFPLSLMELVLMGRLRHLPWYGIFHKEDKRIAEEALSQVGLAHLKNTSFGTLSGGQMQRALIARALAAKPSILLLDEPCANVDSEVQASIYELLESLKGQMTIIMVTHDLQSAIRSVEKVLCVQGTVSLLDPEQVCKHFALGLYHPPLLEQT